MLASAGRNSWKKKDEKENVVQKLLGKTFAAGPSQLPFN